MKLRTGFALALLFVVILSVSSFGQSTGAEISGVVIDSSGAVVAGATVEVIAEETNVKASTVTNKDGIYSIPNLKPTSYRIQVSHPGFKTIIKPEVILNVQTAAAINFTLPVGANSEIVTVEGGAPLINTESATVSTVVDRNFAENMPLNGRSFQTLIELTPGVVPIAPGGNVGEESGQFSVNGQRAAANYWTVDGVSANASANVLSGGNEMSGATGITSVFGGTNSLVPVDDMQEFRIQTSSFAPEYGRTPGGQISIVTRSGANQFHGSAFDYFRNDVLDASNWFNGYNNPKPLPKAEERQNDFGGTLAGPIIKNRTFFFFSYEGLRLRLPTTTLTTVPDAAARQSAVPAMQPILNAFPLDPTQPDLGNGIAQFNASYSNPGTLNDYSLRIDEKINDRLTLFGRYNYSPSTVFTRGPNFLPLSDVSSASITAQQMTLGLTATLSPNVVNEFRFNYSKTEAVSRDLLDNFGGAVPLLPSLPSPFSVSNSTFTALILSLNHTSLLIGPQARNVQHQINMVDTITFQKGAHGIRAGVDYRRLTPVLAPPLYSQAGLFFLGQAENGQALENFVGTGVRSDLLFQNLGVFVQDAWRVIPRLTMTYGVRWDTDFVPTTISGPSLPGLTGLNGSDFSKVTLAPSGTPPFHTDFGNVAPRVGVAYQLSERPEWGRVIRGGFGVFYDMLTSETGDTILQTSYPFSALRITPGGTFPLSGTAAAAPVIAPPAPGTPPQSIAGFDPNLKSPYTLQWNVALEQGLGARQSLSLSYVGATGRRLLQSTLIVDPTFSGNPALLNPEFLQLQVVRNSSTSDYHALQIQFQRRMVKNLQVLSSYTWSHSIDTASVGSSVGHDNGGSGVENSGDRASSDFDVRHAFTLGATYVLPGVSEDRILREIAQGWSLQSIVQAHTAPPVSLYAGNLSALSSGIEETVRPDVVSGFSPYLYGSQFPGGKAFNPAAFTNPPTIGGCDPAIVFPCVPMRQGNVGRNSLRGFGLFQWDLGIHREFPIRESVRLQFRAEMFNVLNHPNFAPPQNNISSPNFGLSSQMLAQALGGGAGLGGLNSIYQIGGPRSIQLALKLSF